MYVYICTCFFSFRGLYKMTLRAAFGPWALSLTHALQQGEQQFTGSIPSTSLWLCVFCLAALIFL